MAASQLGCSLKLGFGVQLPDVAGGQQVDVVAVSACVPSALHSSSDAAEVARYGCLTFTSRCTIAK